MQTWTLRLVACTGLIALLSRLPLPTSVADAFFLSLLIGAIGLCGIYCGIAAKAVVKWTREKQTRLANLSLFTVAKGSRA